jgi:hypothetical protein
MKGAPLLAALLVAACQPQSQRLLLLDLALSDPVILDATAAPWHAAGYTVEYRRFYPHLTHQDLTRYRVLVLLGGRAPETPSDALALGDIAMLTEWARRGGVLVIAYAADGEGFLDRWTVNRWLAAMGTGLVIGDFPLEDTVPPSAAGWGGAADPQPRVFPLPQSALDNAGFEPFSAGRNDVLLVRRESQVLARTSATAFVRPPREAPAPRPRAAVVAAARVGEGLVIVTSRHALAGTGIDLRPSTLPTAPTPNDAGRSRVFLGALARWTRRPAEWAAVAPATSPIPLTLAGAPQPVPVHPPPLAPPSGAAVVLLPQPVPPEQRAGGGGGGGPSWLGRQGMRVLWTRSPQRPLDSLLAFVDISALNVLATEVSAPARLDSLGLRNAWRSTATRLQATSLRWFPAIALADLRPEGEGATREIDLRGDTAAVWCALDSLFWRAALRPAYRALARLGGDRGADLVAGVALDLDLPRGGYAAAGFCDAAYHAGLRALGLDSAETQRLATLPTAGNGRARYDALLESGLLGRYEEALEGLVAQRAAALRAELRRLNPDLRFAFRSAQVPSDWFSLGLLRGFATADAPVLLWTREPRVRELLEHYRARGIFALSAVGLTPERVAANEWLRLRRLAFVEHDGFWLPWIDAPRTLHADSLGRLIRRLAR